MKVKKKIACWLLAVGVGSLILFNDSDVPDILPIVSCICVLGAVVLFIVNWEENIQKEAEANPQTPPPVKRMTPMKLLIWGLTILIGAGINVLLREVTGIALATTPLSLFILIELYIGKKLCEKWDDHLYEKWERQNKQNEKEKCPWSEY